MRHSHRFTAEIDENATLAHRIVTEGARAALNICLRDCEVKALEDAARGYLATDGDDDGDFAFVLAKHFDEPEGYGLPDEGWRGSHVASTWGMGA
ncbi:hypothetical protein [Novosphingobium sp. M1R2S20]|uniref:Uncharacterized protein n=1 Tax=Novosphingobium rhizovicinum TaxID=3228928 RepID=A0ABV3RCR1_9SPHN